jgi:metal-responsive CopG/Arc/MetJ family transcriptional regulator
VAYGIMTDEELVKTTFRLPKSLLKEVKHYATDHEVSDTDVFNEALREYLDRRMSKGQASSSKR